MNDLEKLKEIVQQKLYEIMRLETDGTGIENVDYQTGYKSGAENSLLWIEREIIKLQNQSA